MTYDETRANQIVGELRGIRWMQVRIVEGLENGTVLDLAERDCVTHAGELARELVKIAQEADTSGLSFLADIAEGYRTR